MDFKTGRVLQRGLRHDPKKGNERKINLQNFERKSKQLQTKSDQLQKENNEMEERIASLRNMMQKEREERERLGGSRWKSSKQQQNISEKVKQIKSVPKFKILTDKPLEKYAEKKISGLDGDKNGISFCGQCEKAKAKLECIECGEVFCPPCYKQFHAKGAMRKHNWKQFDQERLSFTREKPSHSTNENQTRTSGTIKTKESSVEEILSLNDSVERDGNEAITTERLLEGTYDEKRSAESFQEALRAWRCETVNVPSEKNGFWVNSVSGDLPKDSKSCETETNISLNQETSKLVSDLNLNFNSSLSYADRLMLKKHRKDPQATLRDNISKNNASVPFQAKSINSTAQRSSQAPRKFPRLLKNEVQDKTNHTKKQNGPTKSKSDSRYPSALNIELLPSDNEDCRDVDSDHDCDSPIINENIEENQTLRTDRRTLSQMGRLAIVEVSFSDPENETKSNENPSALKTNSSMSLRRALSGMQGHVTPRNHAETILQGNSLPHPPAGPSNKYVARQKILMDKNKKALNRPDIDLVSVRKIIKQDQKRWKPSDKYIGLNSFFMAGVERENKEKACGHIETLPKTSNEALSQMMDTNDYPTVIVGLTDWRPESSLSYVEDDPTSAPDMVNSNIPKDKTFLIRKEDISTPTRNAPKITVKSHTPEISGKISSTGVGISEMNQKEIKANGNDGSLQIVKSELSTDVDNDTPRVSMTDFDFLSALPPLPKGDDVSKLHRASTVTLFALSPQPPDVWNDDSEVELSDASFVRKLEDEEKCIDKTFSQTFTVGLTHDLIPQEENTGDRLTLENFSKENLVQGTSVHGDAEVWGAAEHEDEDSLSIEDNDDGSGLTSGEDDLDSQMI